jgi:hypothetical protein
MRRGGVFTNSKAQERGGPLTSMKRNRASLVADLTAQHWTCWNLGDGRILAHSDAIAGSDNHVPLPANTAAVLSDMRALVADDAAVRVETCICSPAAMAGTIGVDDTEFAEHYGFGDSGMNYSLLLYALFTGVDE